MSDSNKKFNPYLPTNQPERLHKFTVLPATETSLVAGGARGFGAEVNPIVGAQHEQPSKMVDAKKVTQVVKLSKHSGVKGKDSETVKQVRAKLDERIRNLVPLKLVKGDGGGNVDKAEDKLGGVNYTCWNCGETWVEGEGARFCPSCDEALDGSGKGTDDSEKITASKLAIEDEPVRVEEQKSQQWSCVKCGFSSEYTPIIKKCPKCGGDLKKDLTPDNDDASNIKGKVATDKLENPFIEKGNFICPMCEQVSELPIYGTKTCPKCDYKGFLVWEVEKLKIKTDITPITKPEEKVEIKHNFTEAEEKLWGELEILRSHYVEQQVEWRRISRMKRGEFDDFDKINKTRESYNDALKKFCKESFKNLSRDARAEYLLRLVSDEAQVIDSAVNEGLKDEKSPTLLRLQQSALGLAEKWSGVSKWKRFALTTAGVGVVGLTAGSLGVAALPVFAARRFVGFLAGAAAGQAASKAFGKVADFMLSYADKRAEEDLKLDIEEAYNQEGLDNLLDELNFEVESRVEYIKSRRKVELLKKAGQIFTGIAAAWAAGRSASESVADVMHSSGYHYPSGRSSEVSRGGSSSGSQPTIEKVQVESSDQEKASEVPNLKVNTGATVPATTPELRDVKITDLGETQAQPSQVNASEAQDVKTSVGKNAEPDSAAKSQENADGSAKPAENTETTNNPGVVRAGEGAWHPVSRLMEERIRTKPSEYGLSQADLQDQRLFKNAVIRATTLELKAAGFITEKGDYRFTNTGQEFTLDENGHLVQKAADIGGLKLSAAATSHAAEVESTGKSAISKVETLTANEDMATSKSNPVQNSGGSTGGAVAAAGQASSSSSTASTESTTPKVAESADAVPEGFDHNAFTTARTIFANEGLNFDIYKKLHGVSIEQLVNLADKYPSGKPYLLRSSFEFALPGGDRVSVVLDKDLMKLAHAASEMVKEYGSENSFTSRPLTSYSLEEIFKDSPALLNQSFRK